VDSCMTSLHHRTARLLLHIIRLNRLLHAASSPVFWEFSTLPQRQCSLSTSIALF